VEQELHRIGRPALIGRITGRVARYDINRVEASQRCPSGQEMRHDVDLDQLQRLVGMEVRIVHVSLQAVQSALGHSGGA
jgi:hypothetical protein